MQPESPLAHEGQIAVFYQRHRTGLVTLVFTDIVSSIALKHPYGGGRGGKSTFPPYDHLNAWPQAC